MFYTYFFKYGNSNIKWCFEETKSVLLCCHNKTKVNYYMYLYVMGTFVVVDELHQLWHGFLTIKSLAKGHLSTGGVTIGEIDA